eukprot:SAG31_NODE_95_length_25901_cov_24.763700_26_plen_815_part_00
MSGLATLFRTDRQPGLAFPTSITPFDCDVPEHANRESCIRKAARASDGRGGHRRSRRRLQMETDSTVSCPYDTFLRREEETQDACGLRGSVDNDAAVFASVLCPSRCVEILPALLQDCASSIEHVSVAAQQYYMALEQSSLFASCVESEQLVAEFAEVEVEFRAPSLAAVNQLVAAHASAAQLLSEPGGCTAREPDEGACDCSDEAGRRSLRDDAEENGGCAQQLAVARAHIAELTEENRRLRMAKDGLEARQPLDDAPTLRAARATGAARRREQAAESGSPIALTAVGDATAACAVSPCELAGACLHGGVCEPAQETAHNAFRCSCTVAYTGRRCEACAEGFHLDPDGTNCVDEDECASAPCLHGGACIDSASGAAVAIGAYVCVCSGGYYGPHCEFNACDGVDCGDHGTCVSGTCACDDDWLGERCRIGRCTDLACETAALLAFNRSGTGIDASWVVGGNPCDDGWAGVTCDEAGTTVVGLKLSCLQWAVQTDQYCQPSSRVQTLVTRAEAEASCAADAACGYIFDQSCNDVGDWYTCRSGANSVAQSSSGSCVYEKSEREISGDLIELVPLTSLHTLDLRDSAVTGALVTLSAMAALTDLNLGGCAAVTGDLHALVGLPLASLDLRSTAVRGDVRELASIASLVSVDLRDSQVSGDAHWLSSLRRVQSLQLAGTAVTSGWPVVTDSGCTFASAESGCAYNSSDDRRCDAVACEHAMVCRRGDCACGAACETAALLAFNRSGTGAGLSTWTGDPCEHGGGWHGVTCSGGAVTGLSLSNNDGLRGTISDSLGLLTALTDLRLGEYMPDCYLWI